VFLNNICERAIEGSRVSPVFLKTLLILAPTFQFLAGSAALKYSGPRSHQDWLYHCLSQVASLSAAARASRGSAYGMSKTVENGRSDRLGCDSRGLGRRAESLDHTGLLP
jgi:hypothetical protein